MKGFKKLIPLILMILTMILVPLGTRADFGDYSGDSDYGDSDWGDSSWDDDSDYDSDYSGSSVGGIEGVIITCVVIFIVAIINKRQVSLQRTPRQIIPLKITAICAMFPSITA